MRGQEVRAREMRGGGYESWISVVFQSGMLCLSVSLDLSCALLRTTNYFQLVLLYFSVAGFIKCKSGLFLPGFSKLLQCLF